ncbi:esterase/lipase family protein [Vibrio sp. 10N]|uniref:esterase/lipase family protein n=1 Tax=Vibrio sp. 10N TaxID=3058938 RepID=UPI0028146814|nr:alpha/beta hydrolase [Vibrio sp. 10N]
MNSFKYWLACLSLIFTISATAEDISAAVDLTTLFPEQSVKRCDNSKQPLNINREQPLVLIVHGCFASAGQFKALAGVYEHLDQQVACFEYDDRDSLERVSGELAQSINKLNTVVGGEKLTIIGHSQGGLISRRAVTADRQDGKTVTHADLELVTVSAPFNGIEASSHCGINWLRIATLGIIDGICYLVTGEKYLQIPPQTDFINYPGDLAPEVSRHLIIKTDESGTCRSNSSSGECTQDDYVFSLNEQSQLSVDNMRRSESTTVAAGHAEIVGNEVEVPWKLIETLQQFEVMARPNQAELEQFYVVVQNIYNNYL